MSLSWVPPKGRLGEPHLPTGSQRPLGLSACSLTLPNNASLRKGAEAGLRKS